MNYLFTCLLLLPFCSALAANNSISHVGANVIPQGKMYDANGVPLTLTSNSSSSFTYNEDIAEIGAYAFHNCYSAKSITIPESVTSIGYFAFSNCTELIEPIFNSTIFARMPVNLAGKYSVPEGITTISSAAFRKCSIDSIGLPTTLQNIESSAFAYCSNIKTITLPNSILSIGEHAFWNCPNLKDLYVGETPARILQNTFDSNAKQRITIHVPANSLSKYKAALYWSDFANITDIEGDPVETPDVPTEPDDDNSYEKDFYFTIDSALYNGKTSMPIMLFNETLKLKNIAFDVVMPKEFVEKCSVTENFTSFNARTTLLAEDRIHVEIYQLKTTTLLYRVGEAREIALLNFGEGIVCEPGKHGIKIENIVIKDDANRQHLLAPVATEIEVIASEDDPVVTPDDPSEPDEDNNYEKDFYFTIDSALYNGKTTMPIMLFNETLKLKNIAFDVVMPKEFVEKCSVTENFTSFNARTTLLAEDRIHVEIYQLKTSTLLYRIGEAREIALLNFGEGIVCEPGKHGIKIENIVIKDNANDEHLLAPIATEIEVIASEETPESSYESDFHFETSYAISDNCITIPISLFNETLKLKKISFDVAVPKELVNMCSFTEGFVNFSLTTNVISDSVINVCIFQVNTTTLLYRIGSAREIAKLKIEDIDNVQYGLLELSFENIVLTDSNDKEHQVAPLSMPITLEENNLAPYRESSYSSIYTIEKDPIEEIGNVTNLYGQKTKCPATRNVYINNGQKIIYVH